MKNTDFTKITKFTNIAVCKNDKVLGFVSGNSVAELKRSVKKDINFNYRNHGIITICFQDRDCINVNSNI